MNLSELLEQINMDTTDQVERQRRIEHGLHALKHGAEIRGVIAGRVTTIGLGGDGRYVVTQQWTVEGEVQG